MASERQFGDNEKKHQVDSFFAMKHEDSANQKWWWGWGWEEEEDDDAGDGGELDGDVDDGCNR